MCCVCETYLVHVIPLFVIQAANAFETHRSSIEMTHKLK